MLRPLLALCTLLIVGSPALAVTPTAGDCTHHKITTSDVSQLNDYQVIELRRYPVASGQRHRFLSYFDQWFPAAFEQLGVIVFGEFYERGSQNFTWVRGFHTNGDRAIADASFYYGSVWLEHRDLINSLLPGVDDNVLQLRPLTPQTSVPVFPVVNPPGDPSSTRGVVVIQIYAVKKQDMGSFSAQALRELARYRIGDVRAAGVLVSLDTPNDFPLLPVRTDGPYLVAIHIVRNPSVLTRSFDPLAREVNRALARTGMLRRPVETLLLDPGRYSRLRWLASCK
jgi:hypothetical protein